MLYRSSWFKCILFKNYTLGKYEISNWTNDEISEVNGEPKLEPRRPCRGTQGLESDTVEVEQLKSIISSMPWTAVLPLQDFTPSVLCCSLLYLWRPALSTLLLYGLKNCFRWRLVFCGIQAGALVLNVCLEPHTGFIMQTSKNIIFFFF